MKFFGFEPSDRLHESRDLEILIVNDLRELFDLHFSLFQLCMQVMRALSEKLYLGDEFLYHVVFVNEKVFL